MEHIYNSERHKRYSEACQKEVEKMLQHPLSFEQQTEQFRRNREKAIQMLAQENKG